MLLFTLAAQSEKFTVAQAPMMPVEPPLIVTFARVEVAVAGIVALGKYCTSSAAPWLTVMAFTATRVLEFGSDRVMRFCPRLSTSALTFSELPVALPTISSVAPFRPPPRVSVAASGSLLLPLRV